MSKSRSMKKKLPYVILAVIALAIVALVLVMTISKKSKSKPNSNSNNKVNTNVAQNNVPGNNRGGNNSPSRERRNTKQINLDTLCSNYLDFTDRVIKGNESEVQFEDFVYLEDNNQRMIGCKASFKKVHRIEEDIPQENADRQEYFKQLNQCLLKSNNMSEYITCFRNS